MVSVGLADALRQRSKPCGYAFKRLYHRQLFEVGEGYFQMRPVIETGGINVPVLKAAEQG